MTVSSEFDITLTQEELDELLRDLPQIVRELETDLQQAANND
ncbi:hypothetical protein SCACP_01150 [Sporomusa carbonis]